MPNVEVKSFDSPDESRPFEGKGKMEIVQLAGHPVGRGTFEPGWRWSSNVKPIAKTDSCQAAHTGYCLQGSMRIYMDDGSEQEISAGQAFAIPPGHDAETTSKESCVLIDMGAIGEYAQR